MWFFGFVTLISTACLLNTVTADIATEEAESWIAEFTGILKLYSIGYENSADSSYSDAERYLHTKMGVVQERCPELKNSTQKKMFGKVFTTILSKTNTPVYNMIFRKSAALPATTAEKLWNSLFNIFSALSQCLPVESAWSENVTSHMVAMVSKEFILRLPGLGHYFGGAAECSIKDIECHSAIPMHETSLIQDLLWLLAPLGGKCSEDIAARNCYVSRLDNCAEDVIDRMKMFYSPPGSVSPCEYLGES